MNKMVKLSLVAALAVSTAAQAKSVNQRLAELEAQIAALKSDLNSTKSTLTEVKTHDSMDNIKWGADLRTAYDFLDYKMADGSHRKNSNLLSTRLLLTMAYAPNENNIFRGTLSYNKAFGADTNGRGWGYDRFDWITNEALAGNELKVKEAYWLYKTDSLLGTDIGWTFSLGRRPSTHGFLANLREDDKAGSPLGHIINMEFDGLSTLFKLEDATGIPGLSFKICAGRGVTNADPMFSLTNYSENDNALDKNDLLGFIFTPYDDGQYIIKTTAFRAWNLPGLLAGQVPPTPDNPMGLGPMTTLGNIDGAAISAMIDGLADDGFLSDTKLFASFAWSRTRPDAGKTMLGSPDAKSGTSFWIGLQQGLLDGKARVGLEYNHGSKYWRSFTYGEDTMIGSKLAARGDAYEAYFTYDFSEALSFQLRYTYIDYKYGGSNGFFGDTGTPVKIDDIKGTPMAGMFVDKAQDIRAYIRYRF